MNPEYASKSGYGASASVELAKNNIQITERHRMKALRPSGRMVFENAKRVHESTVIKAPATYSRLGISSYMISSPLDSVADDSIYRQYGLIIRRRCFLRQEVLAAHGRFDVSPESQGNDAARIWRVFDTCACQARDDPWGGRVEGPSQCRSRRSRKRFVMIPFGYNADRASLHWNNWSY